MAIRRKKETLMKVAGPKLKTYINGHPMNIWIDSGSPISILTLDDLRKAVERAGISLKQNDVEDDEFWDYSNNRTKILGRMELELAPNGWKTKAEVRVIGGTRPSIVGRDLMGKLGLQLMQSDPRGQVMNIQGTEDRTVHVRRSTSENRRMSRWTNGNYTSVSYSQNFLLESEKLETTRFKRNFSKSCTSAAEGTESTGNAPRKGGRGD